MVLVDAWRFVADNPARVLGDIAGQLVLSLVSVVIAIAIAVPLGAAIGHTRRFALLAVNGANVLRALPTLAIIAIGIGLYGVGFINIMVALVILALPLILTNTYVGVAEVEPGTVEAARGMGMTGWQILTQVELPHAVPLIMAGIRTGTVFVIATAYLAGTAGYPHTLGSVITNPTLPVSQLLAYTVIAVLLAFAVDGLLLIVQRAVTPAGMKIVPVTAA
ncbi:ABC transporter permease [Pseudonocardia sp. RS11V-5]|uniref:ABC transporter permease n=1 Tax=Pseudonocardia terrae TaxID=2905831 RepID=UPI001E5473DC|nr:ABC transporter permease [Pseudonocardia terrae]MCE3554582.1 ABC transporter permease [Pseudonocardia terrae]